MSTEVTPDPAPAVPKPEAPAQEATDWKAEARKWEERSKANKTALDELTPKYEAAEAERSTLAERVKEFETKAERSKTVTEVAKDAGVPADALRGNTREELEAHAEVLKALIKPSGPVVPGQEKSPSKIEADPMRSLARSLFAPEAQ
ncbi:hypothetical protein [Citricoccus sp. K5]|uniref:hypothetical protein n=1 Tax=Citricoccus sp. K5 TaxID=2653135 RepID=UPI0012F397E1|nr:hypothetical protein [Citricoccus sp. K5]VXB22771.1 conserved hypothetical protein [Citricoccus sp. K5]